MATYLELRQLFANSDFHNRLEVACIVAAEAIRTEDAETVNHINRLSWAAEAFENTSMIAQRMAMAVLARNKALTTTQILEAADTLLQTAVDDAVDVFATGT